MGVSNPGVAMVFVVCVVFLTVVLGCAGEGAVGKADGRGAPAQPKREATGGAVRVEVVRRGEAWVLLRDRTEYFIAGAGGTSRMETLKAAGGNSVRTWTTRGLGPILDEAQALGMTVMVGLPMSAARGGFNYSDPAKVRAQLDRVLEDVRTFKDHPAVLMWGLGNELELATRGDDSAIWTAVNQAAKEIKALDQNHPTVVVVAGIKGDKATRLNRLVPEADILGVNEYGDCEHVPVELARQGWTRPYVITEFGPRGWWEVEKTEWGAQLEPTSTEKAKTYRQGYEGAVTAQKGRCFGSYVFLWGQKQEATSTWFGLFLPTGEPTEIVGEMTHLWTGKWGKDRGPSVGRILSEAALASVPPGTEFEARIEASRPGGGEGRLRSRWVVVAESTDRKQGGDPENEPPEFPELTLSTSGLGCRFLTPTKAGAYRLFVTVLDEGGSAATANTPFRVVER